MMSAQDDLVKQILGQGLTGKWSGAGHGSAEANAKDMARILSSIGITDIKQLGKVPTYTPVTELYKTYNGQQVIEQGNEDGTTVRYITEPTGTSYSAYDSEGNEVLRPEFRQVAVPKDAKLETLYGVPNPEYQPFEGAPQFSSVHKESDLVKKDGQLVTKTGETFGNKVTGQAVPNTYSERQRGDFFGGTFAGKGNTGYGVKFRPDGTPIFYTSGASSNDLVNMFQDDPILGTVAQIGASYFGGPLGSAALNAAMGKSPQDILKAAALSYAGNAAGSAVSGMGGITDALGDVGTKVASNVAKQFVGSGGQNVDPVKALLGSGMISGFVGGEGDGPNSADFTEGYFRPGGEGYIDPSSGESVFDPTFGGSMPIYDSGGESVFDPTYGGTMPIDGGDDGTVTSGGGKGGSGGGSRTPAKSATPGSKILGAVGSALTGAAGAAGAAGALPGMAQQQTSNADLLNLLGSKPELANIKSYKELFGEDLFGGKYVPPSAGGDQSDGPANYGRGDESSTASQGEGEEQLFRGGHVDDLDVDALLQILRS